MNWEKHRYDLENGETVQFRPRGNSMSPKIESGDLVTVEPVEIEPLEKGDIVFCRVSGHYYVHLIQAVQQKMGGYRYQIGNNRNRTNGTIGIENIFGIVTQVE